MEMTRLVLLSALILVAYLLWNAWQNDYPPPKPTMTSSVAVNAQQPNSAAAPLVPVNVLPQPATTARQLIQVQTDVLSAAIDTQGGNLVQINLLKYPQKLHQTQPYLLLNTDPATYYVANSGFTSSTGTNAANGQTVYRAAHTSYVLSPDQNQLTVDLSLQTNKGLVVHKQFVFQRGSYQVNVQYQIANRSKTPWTGQFYAELARKKVAPVSHMMFGINPYMGAAISSPDKAYEKIKFEKMAEQNLDQSIRGGWLAMQEHYFLSAWVPDPQQTFNYYTHVTDDGVYRIGLLGPALTVAPGAQISTAAKLYAGPELMENLKSVAPNLDLTIDYGILWFISIGILWLMKHIYSVVGNWGWSIVLVTAIIKLLFFHLSAKSYRSMAAMREVQPRLLALRERYGDDKQKLSQATMELYRSEKINPLGGCLPVIVQIPVFIALYFVLIESVELRQAPFIFWIHDLSAYDPFFVLPILMGLTMFIQQRLNPAPPDPTQAKVMMFLPVFFTVMFSSFPAGLVLYWLVNNTLSILQQWYIMRRFARK